MKCNIVVSSKLMAYRIKDLEEEHYENQLAKETDITKIMG